MIKIIILFLVSILSFAESNADATSSSIYSSEATKELLVALQKKDYTSVVTALANKADPTVDPSKFEDCRPIMGLQCAQSVAFYAVYDYVEVETLRRLVAYDIPLDRPSYFAFGLSALWLNPLEFLAWGPASQGSADDRIQVLLEAKAPAGKALDYALTKQPWSTIELFLAHKVKLFNTRCCDVNDPLSYLQDRYWEKNLTPEQVFKFLDAAVDSSDLYDLFDNTVRHPRDFDLGIKLLDYIFSRDTKYYTSVTCHHVLNVLNLYDQRWALYLVKKGKLDLTCSADRRMSRSIGTVTAESENTSLLDLLLEQVTYLPDDTIIGFLSSPTDYTKNLLLKLKSRINLSKTFFDDYIDYLDVTGTFRTLKDPKEFSQQLQILNLLDVQIPEHALSKLFLRSQQIRCSGGCADYFQQYVDIIKLNSSFNIGRQKVRQRALSSYVKTCDFDKKGVAADCIQGVRYFLSLGLNLDLEDEYRGLFGALSALRTFKETASLIEMLSNIYQVKLTSADVDILKSSIQWNRGDVAQVAMRHGLSPNERIFIFPKKPLQKPNTEIDVAMIFHAINENQPSMVRLLLEAGADGKKVMANLTPYQFAQTQLDSGNEIFTILKLFGIDK